MSPEAVDTLARRAEQNRKNTQSFCMVSFMGNIHTKAVTMRNTMMVECAAIRFERRPCICDGCMDFGRELARYGAQNV